MRRWTFILVVIIIAACITSFYKCNRDDSNIAKLQFLPTTNKGTITHHKYYSLSYSEEDEQAEWVAYLLTKNSVNGSAKRIDAFREDPLISTKSASLKDYKKSGYDRGHLCPAADMKINPEAMSETFFMSNMSPQSPSLNRGPWNRLEQYIRKKALQEETLIIYTGPVLEDGLNKIGRNEVSIPKLYYKIVYDPFPVNEAKAMAFLYRNEKVDPNFKNHIVSIDSIETLTGIDFLKFLKNKNESFIESKVDFW